MMNRTTLLIGILFASFLICLDDPCRAGENIWTTDGPEGVRVVTLAIRPDNPQVIYAGTIEDGIYRTTDGGTSWGKLGTGFDRPTMRAIAIHPFAPDTMYAATVHGMYKSTDSGLDWEVMHPPWGQSNEYRALVVHPLYPHILYAGGPFGKWKSTNGGESWYDMPVPRQMGLQRVVIDPRRPSIVYIVEESNRHNVFKSTDLGDTWVDMHNNSDSGAGGSDLALDPVDTDILYLARVDTLFPTGGRRCLSKSTDGGNSWFGISPPGLTIYWVEDVEVMPWDHLTVLIATVTDGIMKSTDGGLTWAFKNAGLRSLEPATMVIDTVTGIIYLGTFWDGIYKSSDGGENWQRLTANMFLSCVLDVAVTADTSQTIFATAWNGVFKCSNEGVQWTYLDTGLPYTELPLAIQADNSDVPMLYLTSSQRCAYLGSGRFHFSSDCGQTWETRINGLPEMSSLVDLSISYTHDEARTIFLASFNGLYRSGNLGLNWGPCEAGLPPAHSWNVVEVARSDSNVIAIGENYGGNNRVFISTDRGDNWSVASPIPLTQGIYVADIEFDPTDASHFYASIEMDGIFETTDRGLTWTCVNNNLPWNHGNPDWISITDVCVNPLDPSNLFVSDLQFGVFQSHDAGLNWTPFNTGLDSAYAFGKILFAPNDTSRLYFGTSLRSVWSIHRTASGVSQESTQLPGTAAFSTYPNPFNASTIFHYSSAENSPVNLSIFDILGRKVAVLSDGIQPSGLHRQSWNAGDLPSGIYLARLQVGGTSQIVKLTLVK